MRIGRSHGSTGNLRRMRRTATAALVALVSTVAVASAAEDALTADEVRKLIVGNTLQGSYTTEPLTMVFYEDGMLRGSIGFTGSDSGTWELEGNKYCNEWITYFNGVRKCYVWVPKGDGYVLQNVDAFKGRPIQGRIEQGKPKGY